MNYITLSIMIALITVPYSTATATEVDNKSAPSRNSAKPSAESDDYSTLYARNALKTAENAAGAEDHTVASSLINLANIYKHQGKLERAEPLYKRALAIYEKKLGLEHPNVALTLNNLADVYSATGRYSEAEHLYKRAIAVDEKSFGPDQPEVANDLYNLATMYKIQGRYKESEEYYIQSMAIFEKTLGADHQFLSILSLR